MNEATVGSAGVVTSAEAILVLSAVLVCWFGFHVFAWFVDRKDQIGAEQVSSEDSKTRLVTFRNLTNAARDLQGTLEAVQVGRLELDVDKGEIRSRWNKPVSVSEDKEEKDEDGCGAPAEDGKKDFDPKASEGAQTVQTEERKEAKEKLSPTTISDSVDNGGERQEGEGIPVPGEVRGRSRARLMETKTTPFGRRLREARVGAGHTQRMLATATDLLLSKVQRLEQGTILPEDCQVVALARALGVKRTVLTGVLK